MKLTFDQNLFTQVDLDSGALTMLGTIVHSFPVPGEYRGSTHKGGGEDQAVFYLTVDKNSAAAHVNIDLATLSRGAGGQQKECCDEGQLNHFAVNPKGYVVFHVSEGSGGYSVHVRQAVEGANIKVFNSQALDNGDIFAASIIRPGTYSVTNGQAKAELTVSYPEMGKTAYRPPEPVQVQVGPRGFDPAKIALKPGQGVIFNIRASARIVVHLVKPDDGPGKDRPPRRRGWSKSIPPELKKS